MLGTFTDRWGIHQVQVFEDAITAIRELVDLADDAAALPSVRAEEVYERIELCKKRLADRMAVPVRRLETMLMDTLLAPTRPVSGPAEGAGG